MVRKAVSRRNLLEAGACALAGATVFPESASAKATKGLGQTNNVVRKWYAGWEKKDWGPLDLMLADNFTFSSAAGDDHISKSAFKTHCWETQIDFIGRFEIEQLITSGNEAFVKYLCRTKNGKSLRNVEYLRLKGEQIEAIECYFGAQSSFPSAVSAAPK